MSDIVIRVQNLSKQYRLGTISHGTLAQDLQSYWAKIRGQEDPNIKLDSKIISGSVSSGRFCALRNISFDVEQGEVLGIIGHNGAGKSTLLKILSRVTGPTKGSIKIKGRIASLLEVGTGFHPELTGRENIFLNGAILGMRKNEIESKLPEIVKFSEIDKFIDTPVKRYSSGMYVRLAFAVAAHLEPEILIVDEVLAVGDASFQKKCLGKMGEVSKEGRTVLFVSHNMVSLQNLCRRGLLIESGRLVMDDTMGHVINEYLISNKEQNGEKSWNSLESAPGNHQVRLKSIRVVSGNETKYDVDIDKDIRIEADYWNLQSDSRRLISVHIHNSMGTTILASSNAPSVCTNRDPWSSANYPRGLFRTSCIVPGLLLNDGLHSISLYINGTGATDTIIVLKDVLTFNVKDTGVMREEFHGEWIGAVRPRLDWFTQQLE